MEGRAIELNEKQQHIIACALDLLSEAGAAGLTMRKIAARAGMRLSNVQYYFKTREHVLNAMVGVYLDQCAATLQQLAEATSGDDMRDRARRLIAEGLRHGVEVSEMCRIFRELWAVSSHDETVHGDLMHYYGQFSTRLVEALLQGDPNTTRGKRLQCLLVPYLEGYSITGPALPLPVHEVTELLTDIVMAEIAESDP